MLIEPKAEKWSGIIGYPTDHSLSPVLHRKAYELLGLPWEYFQFNVTEDELPEFLATLPTGCAGLSVTAPLKRKLAQFADTVDGLAKLTNSANTIVYSSVISAAFNTDVYGITETLRPLLSGPGEGRVPVVLGTGATASSALAAVRTLGYDSAAIVGRSFSGAQNALLSASELELDVQPISLQRMAWVAETISEAPLVISTIPPEVTKTFADEILPARGATLLDVTYSDGTSPLAPAFEQAGGKVASPLAMLTHQGLAQVKLMTNREVPYDDIYHAVRVAAEKR